MNLPKQKALPILVDLFLTYIKIGLFTFGGGYAMISLIEDICVDQKKWITHDELMNMTVIAESTPGPIGINCATYVGFRQAGFLGAAVTTIGVVIPSFVIIYAISSLLDNFLEYPLIASAFRGIKIGVGVLILSVGISMVRKMSKKWFPRVIMGCAFAAMLAINLFSLNFSTITLMLLAGSVSLLLFALRKGGDAK